ncbi:MAG: PQQ-dependent sugar dehydrogenase [Labilithrix sp.]|nr:PQQ-dependent sugar dehydrogenase [Labilithrix sp.]
MVRRRRDRFFLFSLAVAGFIAACGSDGGGGTPDADGGDGSLVDGAVGPDGEPLDGFVPDGGPSDGPADGNDATDAIADVEVEADVDANVDVDGPDDPPVAFPTTTPLLFGYTLQDAFPGTFLSGAMDMEWPAGSNQPFVLQRGGHIVRLLGGGARTLNLNFETQVAMCGEGGALGMALHPKFADAADPRPYVYVWYTFRVGGGCSPTRQRLSRWTWNAGTNQFTSELVMIDLAEQSTQHNGARIRFGPDGFLYFGNGDDLREAQTTQTLTGGLFSGVFRIDVDQQGGAVSHAPPRVPTGAVTATGYFIPNGNPFVGVANANEEYYALGFRNPYGFNFDRANGNLWLGDVGDSFREEISRVVSGGNYAWPFFEGTKRRQAGNPTIGVTQVPRYDYTHYSLADLTAIVAGYPYRGAALPEITGKLIYSDWPTGRVWALDTAAGTRTSLLENNTANAPVGFGQDAAGEVYLIAWSRILKIVRAPAPHGVPLKLSQTKIFRNMATLKTPSAVHPYAIRSPLWSDGAEKKRFVYVPDGETATMSANGDVTLPVGSMLIKHFDMPAASNPVGRTRKLETRVLVAGSDTTYGVTYRWNAAGTDADLLIEGTDEAIVDADPAENLTWTYPSQGDCWSCHRAENRVLAFRGEQLNFDLPDGSNQLTALAALNVFDAASIATSPAPLASPADVTAPIDARASAYLAANCASCHHPGASYLGGGETWNARPGVAAAARGLVNQPHHNYPMATGLGLTNAPLVSPGNPAQSILLQRMKTIDRDLGMPPMGRTRVDPLGAAVIEAWILSGP